MHRLPFSHYVPPIEQTARFCQMTWEEPIIVHGSHKQSDAQLAALGREYRRRLESLQRDTEAAS
jgi:glutathione-regulated potassium-efflux system ancillary protein KefF